MARRMGVRLAGKLPAFYLLLLAIAAAGARPGPAGGTPPASGEIRDEYVRLRAVNAVLRARLALSKEPIPYLILDLPEREMRLELQGVTLTRVPIRRIALNRLAEEISRDTTRIAFCEVPFVLQQERWFESVPTLAQKDTSAVMSRPDTTGALAERIRTTPVLYLVRYERNLAIAMQGYFPPQTRIDRWKARIKAWWRSMKAETPEGFLRKERRESVLVELDMEPAQVRSIAPSLTEGTKLVLRF